MNAGRTVVGNLRALRLLSSALELESSTLISKNIAGLPELRMPKNVQRLISLQSDYSHPLNSRTFASSSLTQQAEPASSQSSSETKHDDDDLYPDMPVYEPLDEHVDERYKIQPQSIFAIVEVGGTQYKVTPDDLIYTEKIAGIDINQKLRLGRVMLLGSTAETIIGRPYIPGASVTAAIEVRIDCCLFYLSTSCCFCIYMY